MCVLVEVLLFATETDNLQISVDLIRKVYSLSIIVRSWPVGSWEQLHTNFIFLDSFPFSLNDKGE